MGEKIKREFSAGGIVFREEEGEILWLIIRPKGSRNWRFPKGWIEASEKSYEAAQREVREEAGIEAEVLGKVGNEKYLFRWQGDLIWKSVVFYLMKYQQEAKSGIGFETEEIDWLSTEEAKEKLAFKKEKELLEKARGLLEKGLQPTLV